jgi:pimeloyl-ACP methyl ester carboxylesterase
VGSEPVAHWEDVIATMDALGIERADLVGSSFGGAVALRVAALFPSRVSSLLLFSAPAVPEPDPSPQLLAVWDAEEEALAAGDVDGAVTAVVSAWVSAGAADEVRQRVAAMQRHNYESHRSEQGPGWAPDPLEEDPALLGAIECPALLAAGEEDMIDFRDAVWELGARLPGARETLIAGCGHLAPLERPEEFRRLLLERLNP